MSRLPRINLSLVWIMVAVAVVSLMISGAIATSKNFPRPSTYGGGHGDGHYMRSNYLDGSRVIWRQANPFESSYTYKETDPHVVKPPRPSLFRIWSPVLMGLVVSALLIGAVLGLKRFPPATAWRRACVGASLAAAIWLTLPALQIVGDPKSDHHIHEGNDIPFGRSAHVTPFWPRYRALLMGRPWSGEFDCALPPQTSMPPSMIPVPRGATSPKGTVYFGQPPVP